MGQFHGYVASSADSFVADAKATILKGGATAYETLKKMTGAQRAKLARDDPRVKAILLEMSRQKESKERG